MLVVIERNTYLTVTVFYSFYTGGKKQNSNYIIQVGAMEAQWAA